VLERIAMDAKRLPLCWKITAMALASGGSIRLIKETLDSVVAPAVRDALIATALEAASCREVPADPEQFRSFVDGPLRTALMQGLGQEMAESIVEELQRMAQLTDNPPSTTKSLRRTNRADGQRAVSPAPRRNPPHGRQPAQRRATTPKPSKGGTLPTGITPPPSDQVDPTATTMPPPSPARRAPPPRGLTPPPFDATPASSAQSRPRSGWGSAEYPAGAARTIGLRGASPDSKIIPGRPYVLVASADSALLRRLTPWLDATAELVPLSGIRELVKDLDALAEGRVVLLVDCRRPSIRPTAVAALADELPSNVRVMLWGASAEQERGVLAVSPTVSRWIVLHGETRPKELAARCADLVG
jgi:hypothetical protein